MSWKNKFPKENMYFKTEKGIVYNNDVLDQLKSIPDESIDCVVTSPPYFNLRDYGIEGQIGLEEDFNKYLYKLIEIFKEVKRILKKDGTCWVNLGDSYGNSKNVTRGSNYNKSLLMIPERFAIKMIDELKWTLRNQIIWEKPNAMPTSAKDRFTDSYEKILFFVKNKKYFFNQQKEATQAKRIEKRMRDERRENYGNTKYNHIQPKRTLTRNKRDIWKINTTSFKDAHFAVFPEKIPEICIKAGCPEDGIVLDIFIGSGTSALVAEKLNRRWIGIELNPKYCEITKNRLSKN